MVIHPRQLQLIEETHANDFWVMTLLDAYKKQAVEIDRCHNALIQIVETHKESERNFGVIQPESREVKIAKKALGEVTV